MRNNATNLRLAEFVEAFNGVDNMRRNFPKIYAAYEKTLKRLETSGAFAPYPPEDFVTELRAVIAGYTSRERESVCVCAGVVTRGIDDGGCVAFKIVAVNKKTGMLITPEDSGYVVQFKGNYVSLKAIVPLKDKDSNTISLEDIDLKLIAVLSMDEINVMIYPFEKSLKDMFLGGDGAAGKFSVVHPAKKAGKPEIGSGVDGSFKDTINVALVNKFAFGAYMDYFYSKEDIGVSESDPYGYFTLDSKGSFTMSGLGKISGVTDYGLHYTNDGYAFSHSADSLDIQYSENTLFWKIKEGKRRTTCSFSHITPCPCLPHDFYYYLKISFLVDSEPEERIIMVTNDPMYQELDSVYLIELIQTRFN